MSDASRRAEVCAVACAEAWRGDGEILANPIGTIPAIGARLARATFAPDLLMTDGEATLVADMLGGRRAAGRPGRGLDARTARCSTSLAAGKRHVMMGASQIDRFGNANISAIGDFARPARQLLGMRGAPGNTVNHPTSYWVPTAPAARRSCRRSTSSRGVGYDSAAAARARRPAGSTTCAGS